MALARWRSIRSERLGISKKAVDFHRRNLLEKMQVGTVVKLGRMIEFLERAWAGGGDGETFQNESAPGAEESVLPAEPFPERPSARVRRRPARRA